MLSIHNATKVEGRSRMAPATVTTVAVTAPNQQSLAQGAKNFRLGTPPENDGFSFEFAQDCCGFHQELFGQ